MRFTRNIILYGLLIVCVIFLYIGSPQMISSRSFEELWELGHIIMFATGAYLLARDVPFIRRRSFLWQSIMLILICLAAGVLTEYIQLKFDRRPDISDLGRDILGGLYGIFFLVPGRKELRKYYLRIFQITLLVLLVFQLKPLAEALSDEIIARLQFPVLADFETPLELDRFSIAARVNRDTTYSRHAETSLKINFSTAKYSSLFLKHFPGDWTGYNYFGFSIFNPDSDSIRITCRIEDRYHKINRSPHDDRFSKSYVFRTGWTDIRIPFSRLRSAPVTREMDMENIAQIGFFTYRLPHRRTVYLDNLRLLE